MSCRRTNNPLNNNQRQQRQELTEQEKERRKQIKRQKKIQKQISHKNKYLPLLIFLKKNGLKFKNAVVDNHTVSYFRLDHFQALLHVRQKKINKNKKIKKLLENWEEIFLYYQRLPHQPHFRYPDELEESTQGAAGSKFASFRFRESESSKTTVVGVVLLVLALLLFPMWPYELKYFLFKAVLYLIVFILGVAAVRIVLHLFMTMFGVDFWLLPNFFANDTTFQTLKPLFSVKKIKGSTESTVVRLVLLGLFFYYSYHIIQDPSIIQKNLEATKGLLSDIDEWGISKLKNHKNFSQSAISNYSQMYNNTLHEQLSL